MAVIIGYRNRVWDTQVGGSDKHHYWVTITAPDYSGSSYDGPGTWGVHTSDFSALELSTPLDLTIKSNLWFSPETPHASDDEFDQSSIDSAWSVYNKTDTAAGSFSFDTIDAYDTTFTSGNVARAVLNGIYRRSWLQLQIPSSKDFSVTKPYTFPTNVIIWARLKFAQYYSTATDEDGKLGLGIYEDSGGSVDLTDGLELFVNEPDSGIVQAQYHKVTSDTITGITNSTDVDAQGQALEYVAIHKIGTTYHGWVGTASGNWIYMGSHSDSRTFAHVGVFVSNRTSTTPAPRVAGVDFVRFLETDNFLL